MTRQITDLEPQRLWQQFDAISQIPHPSGNLQALREYIMNFAQECGYLPEEDAAGNILVRLPILDTGETPIILQSHIDMVPQVAEGVNFDFSKEPLKLILKDGQVMADGTSLGADNGIGVAAMLGIMAAMTAGEIEQRALELLFTVDEETGMTGARQLREDWLRGKKLINLDTEEENVLMTGCAGAVNLKAVMKYRLDKNLPDGDEAVKLTLFGLRGGHSGMDIHLGLGNACKLMNRFLKHAVVNFEARLASVNGGTLRNAIPRSATAVITVPSEVVDSIIEEARYYQMVYRDEFNGLEPNLVFTAERAELPSALLPEEVQDDLINSVEAAFDGVWRWTHIEIDGKPTNGHVDTSSNMASVKTLPDGTAQVLMLIRSMDEERKRALASSIQSAFMLAGARVDFSSAYDSWSIPADAPLVKQALMADENLNVKQVHCGLECGVISVKYPELQIISIGPNIHHPHSPLESVEVDSVERFWKLLLKIIYGKKE